MGTKFNTQEEYARTGLRLTDEQFAKEVAFAKRDAIHGEKR